MVPQMINSKPGSNGLGNTGTNLPTYQKQPPVAIKKIALRDVQNDNRTLIRHHPESSHALEGGATADTIKVSGTKRLAPECPPSSPCHQFLRSNYENEHFMRARRKFESELGMRKIQDNRDKNADSFQSRQLYNKKQEIPKQQTQMRERNTCCVPAFAPIPMTSLMTLSSGGPSVPISLGKPGNRWTASESNHLEPTSVVPYSVDSKGDDDQKRKEWFLHLQKLLKHRDESNQREYIQMLLCLSPTELSRHAVKLETRSIRLTVEEGKEIQRMKALNILGKSALTNNPLPTAQQVQSKE